MDRRSRRWSLGVALLLCSVSNGLGVAPAGHAAVLPALAPPLGQGAAEGWPILRRMHTTVQAHAATSPTLGSTSPYTWTQQAELTSTAQTPNDAYGLAVALTGNTAVVGAPNTPFFSNYGAAYIFERTGSTWSQQADLTDPDGVQRDQFGYAVAVSGTTVAIGAPNVNGSVGAVYVYVRSGGTWSLQATLTPSDAQPENFGWAVALSGDTLVVGADAQNGGNGAVYLFGRSGGVWQQQAEFRDPGGLSFAEFGWAVAVSGDTALVGAPQAPVAYVYVRSAGVWALQGLLHAPHPPGTYFGISVALSGDTALVGACCDVLGRQTGAVYVFGRSGSTWTLQATIPPAAGTDANLFGTAVALSGPNAVISGVGDYAYAGQGSIWQEQGELIPSDRPAYDLSGAVAVSGNTALVGATGTNGAAYVFVRSRVGDTAPADDSGTTLRPAPRGRVR